MQTSKLSSILHYLSSVKITVVCLLLLFILTFWGTVAQVDHGLYAAQYRFFNSFFFLASGFIPFPGAQLVLWVLFINLIAAGITRFRHYTKWHQWGLLLSHAGLILYFVSAFMTLHMAQESNVHIAEGEGTNLSQSYETWEISTWENNDLTRPVTAIDILPKTPPGTVLNLPYKNFTITIEQFFDNSNAFTKALPKEGKIPLNGSGITLLQPKELDKERTKNIAGLLANIKTSSGKSYQILLYGLETIPTVVPIDGKNIYFILRHTRYPLPFTIKLNEFKAEFYPGTETPKSFESFVSIIKDNVARDVRIWMNNPFRYKDYAFFQASYDIDKLGREYSTFAVVKNKGQLLPYIACFIVFFGLSYHFIVASLRRRQKS